ENLDMVAVREQISALEPSEKLKPVDLIDRNYAVRPMKEGWLRKVFRFASWNGFLLPNFLIKNQTVIQDKSFRGTFRKVFRYRRVLYYDEQTEVGYTAEYDRKRFFRELAFFTRTLYQFAKRYRSLRLDYEKS